MKIKRRVIRAVAVSVVCILLAATLLFVGVAADTITLHSQFSSSWSYSGLNGAEYHSSSIVIPGGVLVSCVGSTTVSSLALCIAKPGQSAEYYYARDCTGYDSAKSEKSYGTVGFDSVTGDYYLIGQSSFDNRLTLGIYHFDFNDGSLISSSVRYFSLSSIAVTEGYQGNHCPFFVSNGAIYGFSSIWNNSTGYSYVPFELSYLGFSFYPSSRISDLSAPSYPLPSPVYFDGVLVWGGQNLYFDYSSANIGRLSFSSYANPAYNVFSYNDSVYCINSDFIGIVDFSDFSVSLLGNGVPGPFVFLDGSILYSCSFERNILASQYSIPYTVYTGLPPSGIQIFSAGSSGINLLETIPREGLTSLSAFLGSTDNTSALKASYQDGTVLDFTFDQRFDGYAFGGDAPGSQVYPPVRNVWVDIPIDGLTANLFLLGDYTNGYVTVVDEGWGALVRLNYISPDNYIEFQFFEDSYRITTYSSDGSIFYSKYEQESVKRWRLQIDGVWRDWIVYDPEVTDYFEIRSTDRVEAVMLDFTYVDSGGGDSSGDESDLESSVPDYSDPLWNGLFSGDPLEESKQNEANSRFDDYYSKAQAEQSLAGDVGDMIPDYSLQVDYAGDIQNQVDKWGAGINGGTSAKDMSNWLWSSLGCGAMFSVVMGGVLIRFILQTRA